MDINKRLTISYYKTISTIDESHKIYLVQHQETNKIYIKKILDIYNVDIYEHLHSSHVAGTPRIIDYVEDDNQLIVIEEFISGISLQDKIYAKELTHENILDYILDLCNILSELHSRKPVIIHRDIKPSNIIISVYNKAVLLDFNAAKYFSSNSKKDTVLLGTEGYAAPEQYGFGSSSPQTDIYALGILLQEMVDSINYSSSEIDSIISKCTQINPNERYANVSELYKDILSLRSPKINIPSVETKKFTLPGYRTKTPWHMLVATMYYIFCVWLSLTIELNNTFGAKLYIERAAIFLIVISIPICCTNYLNIQQFMPLCQYKKSWVRYFGIALLTALVLLCIFMIMLSLESLFT